MSVEPVGDPRFATEARLPRRFLFPGDVVRTVVCAAPLAVLNKGLSLDNNVFVTSLALTTLAEPLLALSRPIPAIDSRSLVTFAVKWSASELEKFVKLAIWMLPFVLLSKISWFSPECQAEWLAVHFAWTPRLPQSLSLPVGLYIFLLLVLLLRTLMLLGLPKRPVVSALVGFLSGYVVILYFYNLTGKVHLNEDNWEAPVSGFFGALLLKLFISWHWANLDANYESDA